MGNRVLVLLGLRVFAVVIVVVGKRVGLGME